MRTAAADVSSARRVDWAACGNTHPAPGRFSRARACARTQGLVRLSQLARDVRLQLAELNNAAEALHERRAALQAALESAEAELELQR